VTDTGKQLRALYFTRFASAFGLITLLTLLSDFIEQLGAEGFVLGLFATGLTFAQAVGIVPISWAADRYDKRTVLLGGIGLASVVYLGFAFVESSWQFIAVRGFQGIAATAGGLIALALVGDLARESLFTDRRFDAVVMIEVLEHLPEPERMLVEVANRVLNATGLGDGMFIRARKLS
jgi:MFS family permease